jgi:hypothetical protein
MSRSLSERERILLMCLRESEAARQSVDLSQLAHKTGYTLTTIRTYFTKKLEGVLVFREDGAWVVRGARRCSEQAFARRMTQKAGAVQAALADQFIWRELVRKLLYEGQKRGYQLGPQERTLLKQMETPTVPQTQPGLFEGS